MNPILAAAGITAAGSFLGQSSANAANAREAQRNRDFQERMSSTSFQRAVADMRAAGLNPMLAYQQGGASAPSGSTARFESTGGAAAAGVQAAQVASSAQAIRAQTAADVALKSSQASLNDANARQISLESALRVGQLETGIAVSSAQARKLGFDAVAAEHDMRFKGETLRSRVAAANLAPDEVRARIRRALLDNQLAALMIPGAANKARAESTAFKERVSPFLSDAESLARILKALVPGM